MAGVFNIPSGVGFLEALAAGLLDRFGADPLTLGRVTVLLPTRRAARALGDAFLRLRDGQAMLLPRLRPLGDLDADEPELAADLAGDAAWALPPALPPLHRNLLLTQLVRAFASREWQHASPAQAALLARALARLIDDTQTERIPFSRLADLVPAQYAAHWQLTLDFLRIVTEHWPDILAEQGVLDAIDRRNQVTEALAARWTAQPLADPVIAAGSTGSIPATAALLTVIARMPRGAVVLPGLDTALDRRSWQALQPTHPQWGLKQLLDRLNLMREAIPPWRDDLAEAPRARLLRVALRPAETTEDWRRDALPDGILDGLARVDCQSPLEEATVIALALRAAVDTPVRTAALVTPDRQLARRVAAELGRFGILIDDSAGQPLSLSPPGTFLRLIARAAADRAAPGALLSLLKHPLAAGGEAPARFRALTRRLELERLRGARPAPGFAGALDGLSSDSPAQPWLARLADAAQPFFDAVAAPTRRPLSEFVTTHLGCAEWLAATDSAGGAERLWAGEAGEAAAGFVHELLQAAEALGPVEGPHYPALFEELLAPIMVRPRWGRHPLLAIWGPLEARLQHADLVVLGGLNEGTWPAESTPDPWLSRPMRRDFGLPLDDRRVGQAAHDFAQLAAGREVLLTRAAKVDGVPTVPSRWLLRLDGLLGDAAATLTERGAVWRAWAERLDTPTHPPRPVAPPAPRPPVAARPRRLSVTQVETWMRDPYALFARHILKLQALDPIDADPGAAERGIFIHSALELFLAETAHGLPPDALERLLRIGHDVFGAALQQPGVWAFWWPRFQRIAAWVVEHERGWRRLATPLLGEKQGTLVLGDFTLTARADRIDRLNDGRLAIIDYKTGAVPSVDEVAAGFAPQLPLEAAIAMAGGFPGVTAALPGALQFWRITGGREAGAVREAGRDPEALAIAARDGLVGLIAAFDRAETPYRARPRPDFAPRFSDYVHLARVAEWSGGGAT